ncbi:efflux RND transporter periplasmic adaptor subunit [bacterium]|nr:efflux RND transporter periplasmic adaptor subunit [bacterium]
MNHPLHKRILFFLKLLEIRLRFVLILIITALVVGYWDHIQNYWERWQRERAGTVEQHEHAAEFEFFCPMHPFVVRHAPGKCPICGMELVKRKPGAAAALPEGTIARVQASPERIMQAGVQIEPVAYRLLVRSVRTYGVIEPDETRVARIAARFPGRIEKLMVNAVGMNVKRGEPLARIYSPRFLAAAQEYIQALNSERQTKASSVAGADEKRRAAQLSEYARQRLLLAGFTEQQLNDIRDAGKVANTVTLYSPLAGTVLEKKSLEGDVVEESSMLYTIADLSRLWVQVSVIESDLASIKPQMPVEITTVAFPNEIFYGTVDFIYPTVNPDSRTAKVRVVIDNPAGRLKPGMYVTASMRSPVGEYGPVASFQKQAAAPQPAPNIKLPTMTPEGADRYLNSLAPGAMYYQCPMDKEVISDKPGDCPKCGMHLEMSHKAAEPKKAVERVDEPSTEQWAEGWSCPMHPDELAAGPGVCTICGCGMKLEKIRIERVLSIPESAVIDTGTRKIVYVESQPGVYDSRAVKLGERAGAFYPVIEGLKLGDRVVERGSFLIDAEARLNPPATGGTAPSAAMPGMATPTGGAHAGHQHGS